jgi:phage-related protein
LGKRIRELQEERFVETIDIERISQLNRDLLEFPDAVKDGIGIALSVAQFGGKHPSAKPWKGEGAGLFEIVEDYKGTRTGRSMP